MMTKSIHFLSVVLFIFAPQVTFAGMQADALCWESNEVVAARPELPKRLCADVSVNLQDNRKKGELSVASDEVSGTFQVRRTFLPDGSALLKSEPILVRQQEEFSCFYSWSATLHLEARVNAAGDLLEGWQLVAELYETEDYCHLEPSLTQVIRYNLAE